jgi:hypothetical protein
VTEAEWDACADPTPMLEILRGKCDGRKLRLYCCACNRRTRRRLYPGWDEWFPPILDIVERYADGQATDKELDEAQIHARVPAEDLFDGNDACIRRHSNAILFAVCAPAVATLRRPDALAAGVRGHVGGAAGRPGHFFTRRSV